MTDTIQVGDRVTWTDGIGTVCIGTVMLVGGYAARVQLLDSDELRWPALDWLAKLAPATAERDGGVSDIQVGDTVEWMHDDMPLCGVVQELRQYAGINYAIVHAAAYGGLLNSAVDVRRLRKVGRVTA